LGIDPNVDVKLVPVGNTAYALAALSKGLVQFNILVEPFVREVEKLGYKSLIDVGSLGGRQDFPRLYGGEPSGRGQG
jgi:hypothetical protein